MVPPANVDLAATVPDSDLGVEPSFRLFRRLLMTHRNKVTAIVTFVFFMLAAVAGLVTAQQSNPLTGNWVVRVDMNDGTFRTTYLNLKQDGAKITGTIRVTQFY